MLRWLNQEGAENPCWYRQGKSQWAASSRRAADEQQSPVVCVGCGISAALRQTVLCIYLTGSADQAL